MTTGSRTDRAAYAKQWRVRNRDRLLIKERLRSAERQLDPDYRRKRKLAMFKQKYGLSAEQVAALQDGAKGKCELCGIKPATDKSLHVDHDHKTGRVRGLLCAQCNWYLGKIDRDETLHGRLFVYVKQPESFLQLWSAGAIAS